MKASDVKKLRKSLGIDVTEAKFLQARKIVGVLKQISENLEKARGSLVKGEGSLDHIDKAWGALDFLHEHMKNGVVPDPYGKR